MATFSIRFITAKQLQSRGDLFILLGITFTNLIFYGIFQDNLIFGLILSIESILLFVNMVNYSLIKSLLIFLLLFFLIIFSLNNDFDNHLFKPASLEADNLVARHEHFANELGKLYKNRIAISYAMNVRPILTKFDKNLFSHLDFTLFFNVQNIISVLFIPFFLLGIYKLIGKIYLFFIIYLLVTFIAGGFLIPDGRYGFLLYAPMVNILIYFGFKQFNEIINHAKA